MGCERPDVVRVFERERVVIKASGGPGPAGAPGAQGPQGPQGAQGAPGTANINAQGELSYDSTTGNLTLGPITLNGGNF